MGPQAKNHSGTVVGSLDEILEALTAWASERTTGMPDPQQGGRRSRPPTPVEPVGVSATTVLLTLSPGLYVLALAGPFPEPDAPPFAGVRVDVAPGEAGGTVTVLPTGRQRNYWLCGPQDIMIAKVRRPHGRVIITRYGDAGAAPGAVVTVSRLDARGKAGRHQQCSSTSRSSRRRRA